MSKFNSPASANSRTTNLAGGEAFVQDPKLELISILLTSFVQDQFYRTEKETLKRVNELMAAIADKSFVAKAALYARREFGMRSISHVVAGEIAKQVKGEKWTRRFFDKVVYRVDDMTEIVSYYLSNYAKPLPNALKDGLSTALVRFDEYQLAKYRGEGKAVSLVDVVNLVRPKATPALSKLMKGELKNTQTWEAKLSEAGQKAESEEEKEELKSAAWADLIRTKKIGYFALLKNLRNILEQAPEVRDEALALLTDEKLIRKSLVLPFRYLTAYGEIQKTNLDGARETVIALSKAMDIAVANVPKFDGRTLVALDSSGSMRPGYGANGELMVKGALFGAAMVKANPSADFMAFSDHAEYMTLNPLDSIITLTQQIISKAPNGGTNFHAIFQEANKAYDRIVILSDMQAWVGYHVPTSSFNDYKNRVSAKGTRIYSVDLAGNGSMQFPAPEIYAVAGFSEKMFDIMKLLEQDRNALVRKIETMEL